MKEIVDRLIESKRLRESRVGAFYFIGNKIISNDIDVRDADDYGGFKNYSSHWDLWRAFLREYPEYKSLDYDYFMRGRVVFDQNNWKYIIYLDPKINKPEYISKIKSQYRLSTGSFEVNDKDEHYSSQQSLDDIDPDELEDDVIFHESLDHYIEVDVL